MHTAAERCSAGQSAAGAHVIRCTGALPVQRRNREMTKIKSVCFALGAGTLAVFAGCSSDEAASESQYPQPAATQGDEATPAEPAMAPSGTAATSSPGDVNTPSGPAANTTAGNDSLRDGQIMLVLKSVDQAEIEQGTLARSKATDPRVKAFAERMIEHHSRSLKDGAELTRKAAVEPQESNLATELQTKTNQTLQTLRGADSSTFDSAYTSAQVRQHQEVLDLLDKRLIPSATSADIRAGLKDTRNLVANHLADAQSIMANLKH
jgi:putative membrane protein